MLSSENMRVMLVTLAAIFVVSQFRDNSLVKTIVG